VTLGTSEDEQKIETLGGSFYKNFLFHYNFPPFSVGEVRPVRGPGRREVGHGNLAGRSIEQILPDRESFPYTIRIVSDITESNGSSSMASVCGASLALMQAGVPVKRAIAGVAMGLISEANQTAVLTDILGDEDHLGDMDFKLTGTREGICAIQMDIKISGLTRDIMENALEQARVGRLHILDVMDRFIERPLGELSQHAPRIVEIYINPDRVRNLIGPGGKTIRGIQDQFDVRVSVDDSGLVSISSPDDEACQQAINMIKSLTRNVEPGQTYLGTVRGIKEFGAFVEILPGQEGLLHVTQIHTEYIEQITDILKEGDEVLVKVLEIDPHGKIRLSRKAAIEEQSRNFQTQDETDMPDSPTNQIPSV
jgi:polyribonucleotide nucleotidyltransferase